MSLHSVNGLEICGILAGLPASKCDHLSPESISINPQLNEFVKQTGIRYQFKISKGSSIEVGFAQLGQELLEILDWDKNDISICAVITQTFQQPIPAVANRLHAHLELSTSCAAFDINSGCSGFSYGLATIGVFLQTQLPQQPGKALLFIGDYSNELIDEQDQATKYLFSDVLAVIALEIQKDRTQPTLFNLESDGKGKDAIYTERVNGNNIMRLNGLDVYQYSMTHVPRHLVTFLTTFHLKPKYIILHQANLLINRSIEKQVNMYDFEFLNSLDEFGNAGSASIPLTMALHQELLKGEDVLICGFGVGFSVGSAFIRVAKDCTMQIKTMNDV